MVSIPMTLSDRQGHAPGGKEWERMKTEGEETRRRTELGKVCERKKGESKWEGGNSTSVG